jgi:DNA-binding NarL/FixJ family response regulator
MKKSKGGHNETASRIRVLLVDDEKFLCSMLVPVLNDRGFEVVAVAYTAADARQRIRDFDFDLVILDIELTPEYDTQGFSLVPDIRRDRPQARIAIFSENLGLPGIDLVRRAKELDVEGVVLKEGSVDKACEAFRMIVENPGLMYRDPALNLVPPSAAVKDLTAIELDFIRDYARRPMDRRIWAREHGKSERFFDHRMNAISKKVLEKDLWPIRDTRTELSRLEVYQWARDRGLHFE